MPTTPYLPPAPTSQGSNLSQADYMWMLIVQGLAPLYEVDTSKGSYSEALPPAGVGTSGQTGQGKEIIYVKTSADANTDTITGARTGPVTLSTQYQVARFKSDGTYWYAVNSSSGSSLALEVNGTPNIDQALLNLFAGSGITITDDGAGKIVIAASSASIPSGTVVWPSGWGGWDGNVPQAVVVAGNTVANMLPGRLSQCLPASWKVSFKAFSGTCILDACSIAVCNADSEVVNSHTAVLFGGMSSVSFTGEATSDAIALQIDADHDYYLLAYFDSASSDLLMWGSNSWGSDFGAIYSAGNATAQANIGTPLTPTPTLYTFYYKIVAA